MKWNNLKNNKCPVCNSVMVPLGRLLITKYNCSDNTCSFSISSEKFDRIVNDLYKPKQKTDNLEENMSSLNNLDREEVSDDFSDSPHLK